MKTVHIDFLNWYRHFTRNIWIYGFVIVSIIAVANYLWYELRLGFPPPYNFLLFFAYVAVVIGDFDWNLHRFKREWKKTHSSMPAGNR